MRMNMPPGPGRPKGLKNKKTLAKEQRRAVFDAIASERWEEIVNKLPPTYIADQFIGKAPDTIKHEGLELFLGKKKDES